MPISVTVGAPGDRLHIVFTGNLDISASIPVCELCERLPPGMLLCVFDVQQVERVFDSGVALLRMVCEHVCSSGGRVVLRGEQPEILRYLADFAAPRVMEQRHVA